MIYREFFLLDQKSKADYQEKEMLKIFHDIKNPL